MPLAPGKVGVISKAAHAWDVGGAPSRRARGYAGGGAGKGIKARFGLTSMGADKSGQGTASPARLHYFFFVKG